LGDFSIASYGMVELLMSDKTTRELSISEEVEFTFQFTNNGNDADDIRVSIANEADLSAAGFSFPGGTFVSEDVAYQGTSSLRTLTVRSPSELTEDIRLPVVFKAESTVDSDAPSSEITVQLNVVAPGQSNSLGGNLEEIDKDQLLQYGAIGGAVILLLLLIVVLAKATKRSSKTPDSGVLIPTPLEIPEESTPSAGALDDEFDDFFSNLDAPSKPDEFDNLFDEL
jgi:hypothetical protein